MSGIMAQLNVDVLKVPLGFIRLVELPLSIVAFAALAGYHRDVSYVSSNGTQCKAVHVDFGYPFSLGAKVPANSCAADAKATEALFHESYSGTTQFFVFVGVITMLYCLAILAVYTLLWHKYERDDRYAIVDTIATTVLSVLWLFATFFWLFHAFGVGTVTGKEAIAKAVQHTDAACGSEGACPIKEEWGYGGLVISVIAGFGCLVLMSGNVWFAYKETAWFRNRQQAGAAADMAAGAGGGGPYAPSVYSEHQQPPTQGIA